MSANFVNTSNLVNTDKAQTITGSKNFVGNFIRNDIIYYDQQSVPTFPQVGDRWTEIDSSKNIIQEWFWNGTYWLSINNQTILAPYNNGDFRGYVLNGNSTSQIISIPLPCKGLNTLWIESIGLNASLYNPDPPNNVNTNQVYYYLDRIGVYGLNNSEAYLSNINSLSTQNGISGQQFSISQNIKYLSPARPTALRLFFNKVGVDNFQLQVFVNAWIDFKIARQ